MGSRIVIRGGTVLTLGARTSNLVDADVLVEDGLVAEVGRGLRSRDAQVVDATDTIVMPGFVDTHRHAWKTLLRGLGGRAPGDDLARSVVDSGRRHRPDDVYAATLLGLLGAAQAGITTVVDWADIPLDRAYTDAALQAHRDSGLRTVYIQAIPEWLDGDTDRAAALRELVAGRDVADGTTTIAFGTTDASLSDTVRLAADWASARELGLRIHAHVGVEVGGRGVVAELADRGLLGPDVTLVHGTKLGDADLDAIASSGAAVSCTPASEMARGIGMPPVQALVDRDIRPGLGVDDELTGPGDMFAQMRGLQSVQHGTTFERKLAGKAGVPDLLGTRDVIRYATVDGAAVAGLDRETGSIEVGKQADLTLLRTDRPNIFPVNDPIGAVVWGMDVSNVDWVLVAGRPLVRDGVLDADVPDVRELAHAAHERIAAAASGLLGTGDGGAR